MPSLSKSPASSTETLPLARSDGYRPLMSPGRARRLRAWHLKAYRQQQESLPRRVFYMNLELRVPRHVFPPTGSGVFHRLVLNEIRPSDRVLDMGTGCGITAILAASRARQVVAVDVNPAAVAAAAANAALNGVADRVSVRESDVFTAVDGRFDVIAFDPPYRWFKARDLLELSTADENYGALTRFMLGCRDHLRPGGRIVLQFGTSGDIDYLHHLIQANRFDAATLSSETVTTKMLRVTYFVFRLTPSRTASPAQP